MNCSKCGSELQEGAKFCPACGAAVEAASQGETIQTTENAAPSGEAQKTQVNVAPSGEAQKTQVNAAPTGGVQNKPANAAPAGQSAKNTSSNNGGKDQSKMIKLIVGLVAGVAVLMLLFIGLVVAVVNHKTTINLNKYITVNTEGYDTLGTATYSIDYGKMKEDYGDKIKINNKKMKALLKEEGIYEKASKDDIERFVQLFYGSAFNMMTETSISGSLDNSKGLSNGDEVTFVWDIDEEALELFNVKFKYKDVTTKVEGLEKVDTFDPFDFIELIFTGISPDGKVSVQKDSSAPEYIQYLSIDVSKNNELSNGDTITVTASVNGTDNSYIDRFGKYPSVTSKEYTVEGLMSYIEKNDQIPDELLSKMKTQAEDALTASAAKSWSVDLNQMTYLGNYFLTKKPGVDSWGSQNMIYLVYKVKATADLENADHDMVAYEKEFYYYASFSDLMLDESGNGEVDLSTHSAVRDSFKDETGILKSKGWWDTYYSFTYNGYENLDQLYSTAVTKNIEFYAHEDNVTDIE